MSDTPRTDFVAHESGDYKWNRSINRFGRMQSHAQILERELAEAQAEVVRLKGEAESWEKVFDRTCEHLADAKTELAEAVGKERDAPNSTYQTVLAMAAKIRKGE